ncbi:ExbD/TolR family protein [Primorskyibacter sp. 2E107]|uniref:ExbD/TolR family protein n=1 Tax=Primorskyibacter sp. 2E107 TaxID=3403458 RepID=UPI003AF48DBC
MRVRRARTEREPTIALINIVFLMLIFFLVAGTLAVPLDRDLRLVNTETLAGQAPPDALVVNRDGRLSYRGGPVADAAAFINSLDTPARARVRVVPDRALPAADLVALGRALRIAGAQSVVIVTERGLR